MKENCKKHGLKVSKKYLHKLQVLCSVLYIPQKCSILGKLKAMILLEIS